MRRVDHETIDTRSHQFVGTLEVITSRTDCGRNSQTTQIVFRCRRVFDRFLNVFDGDESFYMFVVVDDEKFFNAVFLKYCFGLLECSSDWNGDERLLRHHFSHRNIESCFETKITVCDDADQMAALIDHRNAPDVKTLHDLQRFTHWSIGSNRHWVDDH